MARLDRLDAEGDGEMRLAHARRAEQHDVLGAFDEAQAGELAGLLAVDRGLNVEVVLIQALEPGQPGQLEAALDAALVPPAPLGLQGVGEEPLSRSPLAACSQTPSSWARRCSIFIRSRRAT